MDYKEIYKSIFEQNFTNTYKSFLLKHEIEERCSYIMSKLTTLSPEIILKNILYNCDFFEIGKLAIDYRIMFLSSDYKNAIDNALSIEIDSTDFLKEHLNKTLICINHAITKAILNGENNIIFDSALSDINDYFKIKLYEPLDELFITDKNIVYYMTHNQSVYCAIFNINIYTNLPLDTVTLNKIKDNLNVRFEILEKLKNKYPNGIDIKLVKNPLFFK